MNYKAIDMKFSETVAEWMAKGYVINTGTMSGIGSEEKTKVDLTNGKEIIRVLLSDRVEVDSDAEDFLSCCDGYTLIVGRVPNVPKDYKPHTCKNFGSPWNHKLIVLSSESFYKIGAEWFVDPKLCIRLGYNYVTSSVSKNAFYNQFINSVSLDCATSAAYMNPSDINRLTVGMGTSLGKFYADIACMFQFQHGDFYAFSTQQGNPNVNNDLPSTRVKLDRTQVMLTLGYRF